MTNKKDNWRGKIRNDFAWTVVVMIILTPFIFWSAGNTAREKLEKEKAAEKVKVEQKKAEKVENKSIEESSSEAETAKEKNGNIKNNDTTIDESDGAAQNKNIVDGYCDDGTPVSGDPSARGRANSCYGHGGWAD